MERKNILENVSLWLRVCLFGNIEKQELEGVGFFVCFIVWAFFGGWGLGLRDFWLL